MRHPRPAHRCINKLVTSDGFDIYDVDIYDYPTIHEITIGGWPYPVNLRTLAFGFHLTTRMSRLADQITSIEETIAVAVGKEASEQLDARRSSRDDPLDLFVLLDDAMNAVLDYTSPEQP